MDEDAEDRGQRRQHRLDAPEHDVERGQRDEEDGDLPGESEHAETAGAGLQDSTPISRPTFVNARTARSRSSISCAALICTRMRASPFGTTGYENPIT